MKRAHTAVDSAAERDIMSQGFHIFCKALGDDFAYDLEAIASAVEQEKHLECIFNGGSGAPPEAGMGTAGMCHRGIRAALGPRETSRMGRSASPAVCQGRTGCWNKEILG